MATVPPTVKLTAQHFGGGFIRDNYASYLPALMIAGALCLMAAPLALSSGTAKLKPAIVS